MLLIDPPSGWKYGFPKAYNNPDNLTVAEWLVNNGYPASEFDEDGQPHWCRFIGDYEELKALPEEGETEDADEPK